MCCCKYGQKGTKRPGLVRISSSFLSLLLAMLEPPSDSLLLSMPSSLALVYFFLSGRLSPSSCSLEPRVDLRRDETTLLVTVECTDDSRGRQSEHCLLKEMQKELSIQASVIECVGGILISIIVIDCQLSVNQRHAALAAIVPTVHVYNQRVSYFSAAKLKLLLAVTASLSPLCAGPAPGMAPEEAGKAPGGADLGAGNAPSILERSRCSKFSSGLMTAAPPR